MATRRSGGGGGVVGLLVLIVIALIGLTNPSWVDALASGIGNKITEGSGHALNDGPATDALRELTVKGKAPMTGYDRETQFGAPWIDDVDVAGGHNGCDTRNDILTRDLTGTSLVKPGSCAIATGTLIDPYTGKSIDFVRGKGTSTAVQIDHVVALGNAWESGGQQLTREQREQIANDPMNLLAVDGAANMQKGKSNAAEWLPPNKAFRCEYVARQIAVKAKYGLSITQSEKSAMERVLATCPGQEVPVS